MKFVISLLLISVAHADPIRVFHEDAPDFARKVKETLIQQYSIPEELIGIKKVVDCSGLSEKGRLDLCLKNNGDLLLVSIDRGFVTESLRIFRNP